MWLGKAAHSGSGGHRHAKAEVGKALIEKRLQALMEREMIRQKRENELAAQAEVLSIEEMDRVRKQWSREDVMVVFEEKEKICLSNFVQLRVIGKGSFGTVTLVRHQKDGKLYAMKKLSKKEMMRRDQVGRVWLERSVLISMDTSSGCKLHYSFQDGDYLYMVMDFLPGGDLLGLLAREKVVSEDFTRFYMAELVLTIDRLHKQGLIHRDIKPDNVLFDTEGHLTLTDFGLCKGLPKKGTWERKSSSHKGIAVDICMQDKNQENYSKRKAAWRALARTNKFSAVGTPNYIAPEVLNEERYSEECDWWSFGCILYEMLVGYPPFWGKDPKDVCNRVYHWKKYLSFPEEVALGPEAKDLMIRLLCERENRLGSKSGVEEIKAHPFFEGIDWDNIVTSVPPFVPELESDTDLRYFDLHYISAEDADLEDLSSDSSEDTIDGCYYDKLVDLSKLSPSDAGSGSASPTRRGSFRKDKVVRKLRDTDVPFVGFTYQKHSDVVRCRVQDGMFDLSCVEEEQSAVELRTSPIMAPRTGREEGDEEENSTTMGSPIAITLDKERQIPSQIEPKIVMV